MKIIILGADGYLGWPTCMDFATRGYEVVGADNYLRRTVALQTCSEPLFLTPDLHERARIFKELSGRNISVEIGDCCDFRFIEHLFKTYDPDCVVHYAEQPSAPYSMIGYDQAKLTLNNNLMATFNLIWGVKQYKPNCHIVKLGTMGEYGTPNIDIEEGYIDIEHKGRRQKFLYPRQAGSLYHTTKILDTDLLWFYVRTHDLRVTDLMQGPVYGVSTNETDLNDQLLPNFHYDDIFGTVLNRFLVQAAVGLPLTVYGAGGQTRGYLNIRDTLQCVRLAADNPADPGQLRILNQFTEVFSVNDLAELVRQSGETLGLHVQVQHIDNPRKELENHYYNPVHVGLYELGLEPVHLTRDLLAVMLKKVLNYRDRIDIKKILPRVSWSPGFTTSKDGIR
ncbi:MAG: NAD-dependent epimerase/dehydratase family protein [Deltaproteobacteria bacterium]|nr:NAD-dependent epimerase/dehydratase family protein [Deltaproteobacteria bacterium]